MIPPQVTRSIPPVWIGIEYASVNCFSPDSAFLLAIQVDHYVLLSTTGAFLKNLSIAANEQARWIGPAMVVLIRGNQLLQMEVTTGIVNEIHRFEEYANITGKGEKHSGNSIVALCGDGREIFVFDRVTGVKGPALGWKGVFDSMYVTPDNHILIADEAGIHMLGRDMVFIRDVAPHNGHHDTCLDLDGSEVMVWSDNRDNCVYKVPLDGRPPLKILSLPWPIAAQISCPSGGGFTYISTYSLDPQYPGQVLKVALDGSGSDTLCDTGSVMIPKPDGGMEYQPQPKASCNGRFLAGCSNFGNIVDPDYCDVWLMELGTGSRVRINYAPYVNKSTFEMVPRPDGAVDIFEIRK